MGVIRSEHQFQADPVDGVARRLIGGSRPTLLPA